MKENSFSFGDIHREFILERDIVFDILSMSRNFPCFIQNSDDKKLERFSLLIYDLQKFYQSCHAPHSRNRLGRSKTIARKQQLIVISNVINDDSTYNVLCT